MINKKCMFVSGPYQGLSVTISAPCASVDHYATSYLVFLKRFFILSLLTSYVYLLYTLKETVLGINAFYSALEVLSNTRCEPVCKRVFLFVC